MYWIEQWLYLLDSSRRPTFNDFEWPLTPISRSRHFSTLNISEASRDRAIVTIEREQEVVCALSNGDISNDLDGPLTRFSRSRHFWSRISEKTARLKHKVTIAQQETIPNIWNGTVFGDLDGPINASRRFVSISWASCSIWLDCYCDKLTAVRIVDRVLDTESDHWIRFIITTVVQCL